MTGGKPYEGTGELLERWWCCGRRGGRAAEPTGAGARRTAPGRGVPELVAIVCRGRRGRQAGGGEPGAEHPVAGRQARSGRGDVRSEAHVLGWRGDRVDLR